MEEGNGGGGRGGSAGHRTGNDADAKTLEYDTVEEDGPSTNSPCDG